MLIMKLLPVALSLTVLYGFLFVQRLGLLERPQENDTLLRNERPLWPLLMPHAPVHEVASEASASSQVVLLVF